MASTADRRYSDDEVARILERAAEESVRAAPARDVPSAGGLTLADLHAIAAEAGIAQDAVARAASVVARGQDRRPEVERWLGLPVAVAYEVAFDGPVSDAAWDEMVAHLEITFDATGRRRQAGGVREWRDGNLRATLEATPTGHRLRLATRREDGALVLASAGAVVLAVGGFVAALMIMKGALTDPSAPWFAPGMILTTGLALIGADAASLRAWGRRRLQQVERLARELSEVKRVHEARVAPPAVPPS